MSTAASTSTEVDLSFESLLAEASARTGLSDFGQGFQGNLRALLSLYDAPTRLTAKGRKATRRRLVELLSTRLRVERAFTLHPEVRGRSIRSPVYVLGLPRTGTSALFDLLASDGRSRPLLFWEGRYPDPPPEPSTGEDPRLLSLRAELEAAYAKNPDFAKIHKVTADGAEECVSLLALSLGNVQMGIEPLLSPYREAFESAEPRAAYVYYRDLLKLLDFQRPGDRWLLKSPAHLWGLEALLELFPDARFVWTHRNPVEVVASYCSMMWALSSPYAGLTREHIGERVLAHLAEAIERGLRARDGAPSHRVFTDVRYQDFVRDSLAVVRRTYDSLGIELPHSVANRLAERREARPQNAHGKHEYDLAQFGLRPEAVLERFQSYVSRFRLLESEQ